MPTPQLRINGLHGRLNALELYLADLPERISRAPVEKMLADAEEAVMQAQEWVAAHRIREQKRGD